MFKCEKCGENSAPGETSVRVPLATRQKEYLAFQRLDGTRDHGGIGKEVTREVVVHARCAELIKVELAAYAAATSAVDDRPVYASELPTTPFNGIR